MNIERVLFINLDRIGDVVRSSFLFRALRARYRRAYIACLAAHPADELVRTDPHIDEVFAMPHGEIRQRQGDEETIFHMCVPVFELLEELRSHDFDLVINPFSVFGAFAVRYIKPRYMMGRAFDKRGSFVAYGKETAEFFTLMANTDGARSRQQCHFADMYARILADIGIDLEKKDTAPRVYISPADQAFADEFLAARGVSPTERLVGFQPGAFSSEKMWPAENFRRVIEHVQHTYAAKIFLNGSQHEGATIIPAITKGLADAPISAAGKTTLGQSAALIARTQLFISNDTGPMHISAALGVPTLGIFGLVQTVPEESRPWGSGHRVISNTRIEDIPVEAVIALVDQMLKENYRTLGSDPIGV